MQYVCLAKESRLSENKGMPSIRHKSSDHRETCSEGILQAQQHSF